MIIVSYTNNDELLPDVNTTSLETGESYYSQSSFSDEDRSGNAYETWYADFLVHTGTHPTLAAGFSSIPLFEISQGPVESVREAVHRFPRLLQSRGLLRHIVMRQE